MRNLRSKKVAVAPARHGLGVFAARRFSARRCVGRIRGKTVADPGYSSDYCMDLGGDLCLDPSPPFRYLNHSCSPNCLLVLTQVEYDDGTPPETEIWLEAIRDIHPGEELTIDYGWPAESPMPCDCGSPNCRGWIVAEELLDGLGQAL
ncbi:MAG: SET domain-containing protein-lysine N-methyltransferase [Thermoguttaceae bacterium]|nr:SET domain-containing protein-lysine N-methyltransferase [Thermoguttaceae bacterium]